MTPRRIARRVHAAARGQGGVALPMALIVLVVLTSLAAAVLAVGTSETTIATNHMLTAQALALAEAGLESAFTAINSSLTGTSLVAAATSSFANLTVTAPTGALATLGTYTVQYKSIGTNTVEVVSTGTTTQGGARRILRALMTSNLNSVTAVLSEGNVGISGNVEVAGSCGSVHSNANLTVSGGASLISQNATASGAYSGPTGPPQVGGTSGGTRPKKVVPVITPATYRAQALSKMASDSTMYLYDFSAAGAITRTQISGGTTTVTALATLGNNDTYLGWKFKSAGGISWEFTGADQPGTSTSAAPENPSKAVFYVNGKAVISADAGTAGSRWNATVISTGDLDVTSTSDPFIAAAMNDLIFVVGGDFDIAGNPNIDQGVIAVSGNIDLSGTVGITGSLIARGTTSISGNVNITYSCGLDSGITAGLSEIAWGY